ncbi:polysaccharide deacetylase family protein [Ferrimonas sp. YFM]|uniref:polysaccharide deacetylase family protein n=1 Tax=Ferrimonas sp. YFM TaxID=3028878 RepID=UPI002573B495|nr:polysaccharide deacetylase family protein [Ferrimonas sp. YFM]BDY03134.1 polysaccharide deacetylase [Ferrimonas sp. YFM]
MKRMTTLVSLLALLWVQSAAAAVILQYHHVSEDTPASTSVTPAQFQEQMAYLAQNEFSVVPLTQVIDAIRKGEHLPPKTVAITFDDGYRNVADNAHPVLKAHGFPYTLFVAIEPIERNFARMMNWDTLRQLSSEGAVIANHSWGHEHLIRRLDGEDEAAWLDRIQANLERTEAAIEKELGYSVRQLAYPYGEFNQALRQRLEQMGYVGIGQHSGAAGPYSSLTAVPRFPVAGPYADMDALKVKLHSLNMPAVKLEGDESELKERPRPILTVTLEGEDLRRDALMCYIQGQGGKAPTWLDEQSFTIQADLPLPAGRSRYNCTAPSRSSGGYYWFSQPWVQARADGSWPKE